MTWEDDAACRDNPFFTELEPSEAKRICQGCPVIDECLSDAIDHELQTWRGSRSYLSTVRGGLSVHQRVKVLRDLQVNVGGRLVMRETA
jgi:hypothetical protein